MTNPPPLRLISWQSGYSQPTNDGPLAAPTAAAPSVPPAYDNQSTDPLATPALPLDIQEYEQRFAPEIPPTYPTSTPALPLDVQECEQLFECPPLESDEEEEEEDGIIEVSKAEEVVDTALDFAEVVSEDLIKEFHKYKSAGLKKDVQNLQAKIEVKLVSQRWTLEDKITRRDSEHIESTRLLKIIDRANNYFLDS